MSPDLLYNNSIDINKNEIIKVCFYYNTGKILMKLYKGNSFSLRLTYFDNTDKSPSQVVFLVYFYVYFNNMYHFNKELVISIAEQTPIM